MKPSNAAANVAAGIRRNGFEVVSGVSVGAGEVAGGDAVSGAVPAEVLEGIVHQLHAVGVKAPMSVRGGDYIFPPGVLSSRDFRGAELERRTPEEVLHRIRDLGHMLDPSYPVHMEAGLDRQGARDELAGIVRWHRRRVRAQREAGR